MVINAGILTSGASSSGITYLDIIGAGSYIEKQVAENTRKINDHEERISDLEKGSSGVWTYDADNATLTISESKTSWDYDSDSKTLIIG